MATPYLSALGQVEIGGEESEFGEETSNYVYLRTLATDRSGLTRAALDNEHLRAEDYQTPKIIGQSRGTFTTRMYLHGFSSSAPSSASSRVGAANASATAWDHIMDALASALGGIKVGGFKASENVDADGTPTDTLEADDLSSFFVGGPILFPTQDDLVPLEVGWIKGLDTGSTPNTATLLQQPDSDPATAGSGADTIWGGYCIYQRTGDNYHRASFTDKTPSWSIKHTQADGSVVTMLGCRPSKVTISIPVGDLPTIEVTWSVAHWTEATGGSLSVQSWAYPEPAAVSQWLVRWGVTSPSDLTAKSIEIDFGIEMSPMEGGFADSGVEGWYITKRMPTVSVTAIRSSLMATAFNNQNQAPLTIQIGSEAGKTFALCIPNAILTEYPTAADDAGAIASSLTFTGTYYSGDAGDAAATTAVDSQIKLAFC